MEITRDEVRVMTVHGAKGLEAPIVILADTTSAPAGPSQRQKKLFALPASVPDAAGPLVWAARKDGDVAAVRAARENAQQAAADEYRRLLYVAMTRAAERLIVCGVDGANKRPEGCWYDLIRDAIEPLAEAVADGDETVLRYRSGEPAPVRAKDEAAEPVPIVTPPWLSRPVAPEPRRPVLLTPSNADDEPSPLPHSGMTDRSKALARGALVHRLMQSLPDIPPPMRADAARQYLARRADQFSDAERQRIHDQVLAILDNTRFAPLFAPGSCAEVPIVGRLPHGEHPPYLVSGQVDRLVVTADAVFIADYKTNTPAPRSIDESPPVYIRQLAVYRAVLGLIYPGRTIRAALVWTEIPDLMEIPAGMLDDHIRTLTSA
jgi:ATP-dependent helicase/nuclease subunit A